MVLQRKMMKYNPLIAKKTKGLSSKNNIHDSGDIIP
jgi:hypothetical protein